MLRARTRPISEWDVHRGTASREELELQMQIGRERKWRFSSELDIRMEMERAVERRRSPDGIARAQRRRQLGG